MNLKTLFLLAITIVFTTVSTIAQNGVYEEVINTPPPSEETWNQIQEMGGKPSLRAKPDDTGQHDKPQKVFIGYVSILQLLTIGLTAVTYKLYNKKRRHF